MRDYEELVKALRENAEWADGNIWEVPIMLPDNLKQAADAIEELVSNADKFKWIKIESRPMTEEERKEWSERIGYDIEYGKSIMAVLTAPNQFYYRASFPATGELKALAADVLSRWERERNGETDVGRVLPSSFMWYRGDGVHNHFRDAYKGGDVWDWSLKSPYEEDR